MNPLILNRDFKHPADGWYMIEPAGEHLNQEAGVVQVLDQRARQAIVEDFNRGADAQGDAFPGMLVDHEHFKHQDDQETRAYGWLLRTQNRADGIYGRINWTSTGKPAVDGGDYRYFSTEYDPAHLQILNRQGDTVRARPLRLAGLTLTNSPNNRGGKPITNRQAGGAQNQPAKPANTKTMKSIAARLSLSPDASEESILTAVDALLNRATTAEGKLSPLTTERDTLKNRVTTLETVQAESDLTAHGIAADDADRPELLKLLIANRDTALSMLKRMAKPEKKEAAKPLTNRGAAKTPTAKTEDGDQAAEQKTALLITNRAANLRLQFPAMTPTGAWNAAQKAIEAEQAVGMHNN